MKTKAPHDTHKAKAEILEGLKKHNIHDINGLADWLAAKASEKDAQGNPIVMTAIVSPGFFVTH